MKRPIPDTRYRIPDTKKLIPDSGFQIPDKTQKAVYQASGSRHRVSDFWHLASGICLFAGIWYLASGICVFAAFLNFGGGARNAALSQADLSQGKDIFSAQLNPALISRMEKPQMGVEHQRFFTGLSGPGRDIPGFRPVDLQVSNLSLGVPFRKLIGNFGISYLQFSGAALYQEETVMLHIGRVLNDLILREEQESIGIGFNLKFLKRSVETDAFTKTVLNRTGTTVSGLALDLGSFYLPSAGVSVAVVIRNLLSPNMGFVQDERIPKELAGGVAWESMQEEWAKDLLLTAALSHREGEPQTNFHAGLELRTQQLFSPRIGFSRNEFSSGFGIAIFQQTDFPLSLDYAFVFPLSITGTTGTHRFGVKMDFKRNGR